MATYGKGEAPSFIAKACKNLDNQIDNYIDRQMDRYVDELELDYIWLDRWIYDNCTCDTIQKDGQVSYLLFREVVIFIFFGGCYTDRTIANIAA